MWRSSKSKARWCKWLWLPVLSFLLLAFVIYAIVVVFLAVSDSSFLGVCFHGSITWNRWIKYFETVSAYISKEEVALFMERILVVMTSSIDRRFAEFENFTW